MKVLVCIPAYRCEAQIGRVIGDFNRIQNLRNHVQRILIIDNQSPDATIVNAKESIKSAGLTDIADVVQNERNYGLGGSHKVAFKVAKEGGFDYLVILHGDHQAKTEELVDLLRIAKDHPDLTAVLGARFSTRSRLRGYSKQRMAGNLVLNFLYTLFTGRWTIDLGSGLNVFKVSDLDLDQIVVLCADTFTFNMDLLLLLYSRSKEICFHPITWSETDQTSNARNWSVAWNAFKTLVRWKLRMPKELLAKATDYQARLV